MTVLYSITPPSVNRLTAKKKLFYLYFKDVAVLRYRRAKFKLRARATPTQLKIWLEYPRAYKFGSLN